MPRRLGRKRLLAAALAKSASSKSASAAASTAAAAHQQCNPAILRRWRRCVHVPGFGQLCGCAELRHVAVFLRQRMAAGRLILHLAGRDLPRCHAGWVWLLRVVR
jgi:hypothetical protein